MNGRFGRPFGRAGRSRCVASVEASFEVTGRGCFFVIVPSRPISPRGSLNSLKADTRILLKTPGDGLIDTHISSIEFLFGPEKLTDRLAVLLRVTSAKAMFPTEHKFSF